MSLWAGFAAGALHVVSGPDHLAALGPAASRAPTRAARLGATWGLGHGVGVLAVALAGRLLGDLVALDRIGAWAELSVGFVLVALGVRALARTLKRVEPAPPDARGPFWIGVLHGAAGAHHLLLVLPALLLDPAGALSYLGAYLVAAVLAMAAAGALLARSLRGRGARAHRVAQGLAGAAALLVGAVWIGASVQLA